MVINFNPETHQYTLDGQWRPGCTRVLADMGYVAGADFFTEESRIRGRQAHLACQWADQYCPDAATLPEVLKVLDIAEDIHPYLQGYLLFKQEAGYRPIWHERYVYAASLQIVGTPDSWGEVKTGFNALVDLKTWRSQGATPKRAAILQTAIYQRGIKETFGVTTHIRWVVSLPGNGRYRIYQCMNPLDDQIVSCISKVWWDRYNNKLIKPGPEVELTA